MLTRNSSRFLRTTLKRFQSTTATPVVLSLEQFAQQANVSVQDAKSLLQSQSALSFENNSLLSNAIIVNADAVAQQITSTLNPEQLKQELDSVLSKLQLDLAELKPLQEQKAALDAKAHKRINTYWYGTTAYLIAQMAYYAKLTWIDYGWDVMEPITYMTTFTVILGSYIYFILRKKEYTYVDLMSRMVAKRAMKEYRNNKFNVERYTQLQQSIATLRPIAQHHIRALYGNNQVPETYAPFVAKQ